MNRDQFLKKFKENGGTKEQVIKALEAIKETKVPFEAILQKQQEYNQNRMTQEQQTAYNEKMGEHAQMVANRPQRLAKERQDAFGKMGRTERVLSGVGEAMYSTPGIKQAYDVAGKLPGTGGIYQDPSQVWPSPGDTKEDFEMYDQASAGDPYAFGGRILGDIGVTAIPVGGAMAKAGKLGALGAGLVGGATSAGIHQAQRLQRGQELDPVGAGIETGASGLIGGLGGAVGRRFKETTAPGVLHSAVKPPRKYMDAVNKPNFKRPLDRGLVERTGGLEGTEYQTTKYIEKISNMRDDLISNADIKVDITGANKKVGRKLYNMARNGEIDLDDAGKAYAFSEKATRSAGVMPSGKRKIQTIKGPLKEEPITIYGQNNRVAQIKPNENGKWEVITRAKKSRQPTGPIKEFDSADEAVEFAESLGYKTPSKAYEKQVIKGNLKLSGSDAVKQRKLADKKSKFNPFKGPVQNPDEVVFNEAYRRVLNEEIERELAQKGGLGLSKKYKELQSELSGLIPYQKAVQFKLGQAGNNFEFGLLDFQAMGLGGILSGGATLPAKTAASTGLFGLRRLTSTPGGARNLHDLGSSLTRPSGLRNLGMQTGRSTVDQYRR